LARLLATGVVSSVLAGWALAQYPYLIVPDFNLFNDGASASVLAPTLAVFICGSLLVAPAFVYLYRVFKHL